MSEASSLGQRRGDAAADEDPERLVDLERHGSRTLAARKSRCCWKKLSRQAHRYS